MTVEIVDKKTLLEKAENIEYREDDIKEAKQYGCKTVFECYKRASERYSRYFLVVDNNKVIAPIVLNRCGYLTFFVNKELSPNKAISFVRELKKLAKWYTDNYEKTIFVKTANWYKEAKRLNKLVGFKPYILRTSETIWVYNG